MSNRINGLEELQQAALNRRAVVIPHSWVWRKPKPAAVIINLPGSVLIRLFNMGIYLYEKQINKGGSDGSKRNQKTFTV